MDFPGVDHFKTELIYRSVGGADSRERVGAGFMSKSARREDNIDLDYPFYVFVYILNGSGIYVDASGKEYPLGAGDYFQRFPGSVHSNYIDTSSGWRECYLQVGSEICEALSRSRMLNPVNPVGTIGFDLKLIRRFWDLKERYRKCPEIEVPQCVFSSLTLLSDIFERERKTSAGEDDLTIERACEYLSGNLAGNRDFRAFCLKMGCGYEKFRKLFQRKMGLSPGQYRIRRRLDLACEFLDNTQLTVAEVSYKLGYSSQYEFSAQLKKHLGVSPRAYRQRSFS